MGFPEAPTVYSSRDYDSFKIINFNRELSKSNLQRLRTLTEKEFKLHMFPIIVSTNLEIIDGQHRFHVAKEMGAPIYYIVQKVNRVSVADVYTVNIAGKKHSIADKLEMLYKAGHGEIWKVYELYNLFAGRFRISDVAMLCFSSNPGGTCLAALNNDTYTVKNYKMAKEILTALNSTTIPNATSNKVILSISIICANNDISPSALIQRLESNRHLIMNYAGRKDMEINLCNAYNYNLTKKNKLRIDR